MRTYQSFVSCQSVRSLSVSSRSGFAGAPAKPLRELTDKDRTDWHETKDWYVRMAAQYLEPDNYHPVK